jgi:hypothetical protein
MTSVRVYLHNETGQTLVAAGVERLDGNWRGGGAVPAIAPGTVAMTGTKAVLPSVFGIETDGTECVLHYRGEYDESTTFRVHWNNPAIGAKPSVSLDGGINVSKPQFHCGSDEAHYSFWQATGRAEAVVHFFFRDARTVMTDFRPSNDGFLFNNSGWTDAPYTLPPLQGTPLDITFGNANTGLCGGMVFAALDYFYDQQRIPQVMANPDNRDPLFLYLVARLFDTFDPMSISLLLALMSSAAADDDETLGEYVDLPCRARVMAYEEWPLVRADIDAGRPSPLVLQTIKSNLPWDLGHCHQVLVYGYEAHGHSVKLHVYDPNKPLDDDVWMTFQDGDIGRRIKVDHNVGITEDDLSQSPIYCFIRMNYDRERPPIRTEPRMSTHEIETRHLSIVWNDPVFGQEYDDGAGRRTYDIWPDCGTQDLAYTIKRRSTQWDCTFTAYGFYRPEVDVRVGPVTIPPQSLSDYTLPGQVVWQPAAPVPGDLGLGVEETRDLHFRGDRSMWDTLRGGLALHFRAEDGNVTVPVTMTCREAGAAPASTDWVRTFSLEVEGWREDVPGLLEARRECFKKYLDAHRDGQHDVANAAAEIEFTRAGRPGNPLLDPDFALLQVLDQVRLQDPRVLETTQVVAGLPDLKAEVVVQVRDRIQELAAQPGVGAPSGPGIDIAGQIQDAIGGIEIQRPT